MVKYPIINSKNFYRNITKTFKKYKIHKTHKTEQELCNPKKFKLQNPQTFVASYISPKTPYRNLLVFHQIGSGKTCASIQIAEKWKQTHKIMVAVPASLILNFKKELISKCVDAQYITDKEVELLKTHKCTTMIHKNILKTINKRISKHYEIISHQILIQKIKNKSLRLKNKVLIIDEIQNLVSIKGSHYNILHTYLSKNRSNNPIVLLSATPMFDKPIELSLTLNLLDLQEKIPIGKMFENLFIERYKDKEGEIFYTIKNTDMLSKMIKGYVSYFRGAHPKTFPKKKQIIVKCKMKEFQLKSYLAVSKKKGRFKKTDLFKISDSFFIGIRAISNVAFPNRKFGKKGFDSFNGKLLKGQYLRQYSEKFYKIIKFIKRSQGPVFIYSNFKNYFGIKSLIKVLEAYKYIDFAKNEKGSKRYAVWSGDTSTVNRNKIIRTFNSKENMNGEQIKILLGTPSIKEGVSLLRVEQVHILEPYWNISRLDQIIGRAIRYCSHKDVPKYRKNVTIYMYESILPTKEISIDTYITSLAERKQIIITQFENVLKHSAIDCNLNKNANFIGNKKKLKCKI